MFGKLKALFSGPPLPAASGTTGAAPEPAPTPAPAPAKEEKPADKENEAKTADKPQANPDQVGPEGQEEAPPPPPPIVINKYSDEQLRLIIKRMRDRLQLYKEKVADQYASSPEISPPVTPLLGKDVYTKVIEDRKRQAEEDRIKKEEADKKKKEEQEQKKKEAEQKKKEEEEKKKAEAKDEKKEEKSMETRLKEATWYAVDVVLKPIEDLMDGVLGKTIDPFTDRRYIAWLSIVTLAFNYNTWFITARLCFPYHTESAIPYWFAIDMLVDLIYLTDSILFQPRKQFVKGGDIIKDREMTKKNYRNSERSTLDILSLLPFDLLYFQFGFRSIFRANRLLKADTFFEFSDRLESLMAKAYIWRVIRTIGYLLFMLHLNACCYYVASAYQGIGGTKWVYSGLGSPYLSCFFYAEKSLLMIAELPFPDTMFGQIFQMTNYLFGAFFMSIILGQMRDVIGAATAGKTYFRSSMDSTVEYMVNNCIPPTVQNRVRTWYTYTWDAQGMLDESELLDKMPLVMRTAIAVDINLSTFQKIALFQVIHLLQSSKDGGNRRTANVKAYGFANLFVLEKKDLFDILVHYPESQKVLARKGKKLMKAKGPAAAKVEEEKKKGLALFGPKPPTPKMLRAFGGNLNKTIIDKIKTLADFGQQGDFNTDINDMC
ncbi:cyclic nucleotide-gated cation channel beta-3-like [Morone saxatilis]|uniref:cyclic nucleotide-gated cation channel beta-3-like n=1 Tax=Morone saxatilis TaxID=34816 RepID=UPI0015E1D146|nr:cyclic nucleotide-gated cation channel beta-3-like [Morone saxatilis]